MKHLLLVTVLTLTACGKRITSIENKYNDSSIKAYQVIQDARIAALEAKFDVLNSNFDAAIIDFDNDLNNLQSSYTSSNEASIANYNLLSAAMVQLSSSNLEVIKICSSGEHLLKNSSGVYAVYMVSNNYGTFLGKLANDVNYQTTDSVHASFKLVDNNIVCL